MPESQVILRRLSSVTNSRLIVRNLTCEPPRVSTGSSAVRSTPNHDPRRSTPNHNSTPSKLKRNLTAKISELTALEVLRTCLVMIPDLRTHAVIRSADLDLESLPAVYSSSRQPSAWNTYSFTVQSNFMSSARTSRLGSEPDFCNFAAIGEYAE